MNILNPTLGVDIGGVIIDRQFKDGNTSSFSITNYFNAQPIVGAFEALRQLVEMFEGKVYLVSSCTESVEESTIAWFQHYDFFNQTGITRSNLHFCRRRLLKAPICEKVGVTHFVDDRVTVLRSLTTVKHLFLFGSQHEDDLRHAPPKQNNLKVISSWSMGPEIIRTTL